MAPFSNALPSIGVAELPALDAGTVDFEGELFDGNPNFDALRARDTNHLTTAKKILLIRDVCAFSAMLDEFSVDEAFDLPPEV